MSAAPRTMRTAVGALRAWMIVAAAAAALASCSEDPTGSTPTPSADCEGPSGLGACPSWSQYSPLLTEQAPAATTTAPIVEEETAALERIDDLTGELLDLGSSTFVCTTREYDFVNNPDQALSLNIDETVIWPGALIQGKSHRDAAGGGAAGLLELPLRERTPVEVSVTFSNQNNTATVSSPTTGSVNAAVRAMIGTAEAEGLATSNSITFSQETYTSEQQAAVAFGVSGRYLGFEASATGSVSSSITTNIVAAQLKQQMYVVNVTQPATPAAFFADGADAAFSEQVALHRVGPDNPPLYVSRIGYGRMMVFSLSAKAEANAIKGAISAAYNGIGGGGSGSLSARDSAILASAEVRFAQIGGDQSNALAAIKSGNLADYFTDVVPLTAADPIWFELKTLTGEVAYVSEPGTYTQTTCEPKLPGTFEYSPVQNLSIPFSTADATERTTVQADVNGDGRMDLVFNERRTASPALNRVHVAVSDGAGTFSLLGSWTHSANPAEGWEQFDNLLVADVDGDGRDDLVWNALTPTQNAIYTALSLGDGSFAERPRQERPAGGWNNYSVRAGDLDGDGQDDLLWSNAGPSASAVLRTYYALAQDDTTFHMAAAPIDRVGDYSGYEAPVLAQLDRANGLDFVVNARGSAYNNAYVGRFTPASDSTGTLSFPTPFVATLDGWNNYKLRVGNVDGMNGADMVFVYGPTGRTYRALNTGDGTWATNSPPRHDSIMANDAPFLANFNDDPYSDLLLINLSPNSNQLITGFGTAAGSFSFPAGVQSHPAVPASGWETFTGIFVGDVNGDGKADVVWTSPAGTTAIYVALAR